MNLLVLHTEVLVEIINYLHNHDILMFSEVCKKINLLCNNRILWKNICKKKSPHRNIPEDEHPKIIYYLNKKLIRFIEHGYQKYDSVAYKTHSKRAYISMLLEIELDTIEYWNWDPEIDPDTEWVEDNNE